MGDIYIDITVINDVDLERQRDVQFLADTGATKAWIPQDIAEELDIRPIGHIPLELANGEIEEYPYGLCKFSYEGELMNGVVIIGPTGIEPLAGTHLLQEFRLILDMAHDTVRRARAMRAK
jgi:predicted aspartyl protease